MTLGGIIFALCLAAAVITLMSLSPRKGRPMLLKGDVGDKGDVGEKSVKVSATPEGKLWQVIASGICPDCNAPSRFLEGPSGGMSTNIKCEKGHWFNVTPVIGIAERIRR